MALLGQIRRGDHQDMLGVPAEMLSIVAVLILAAVAAGTLAARLFIAATRTHMRGSGQEKEP